MTKKGGILMSTGYIIPEEILKNKRLEKLLGADYCTKPRLREFLSRLEGVQRVDDMDGGRGVEWSLLSIERERKIAVTYFWRGVDQAQRWREEGLL